MWKANTYWFLYKYKNRIAHFIWWDKAYLLMLWSEFFNMIQQNINLLPVYSTHFISCLNCAWLGSINNGTPHFISILNKPQFFHSLLRFFLNYESFFVSTHVYILACIQLLIRNHQHYRFFFWIDTVETKATLDLKKLRTFEWVWMIF